MKKIKVDYDQKYLKICVYAGLTVIGVVLILCMLYLTSDLWLMIWNLFKSILRPVVLGGIFCYLLTPVVNRFEKSLRADGMDKIARPVAVFLGVLLTVGIISAIIGVVVFTMYRSLSEFDINNLQSLAEYAEREFAAVYRVFENMLSGILPDVTKLSSVVRTIIIALRRAGSGILFGVIFGVYFLLDQGTIKNYWSRVIHLIAGEKYDTTAKIFLHDANVVFSGYIRGQFIDASCVGTLTSLAMAIVGVPNAIVIGVLTGVGNLIPYVGPVVGYVTLIVVCVASGAWMKLAFGAVILAVVLFVDGNIINPKLLSSNIKIHPLLVIAALIGGGVIGGFVGMIVAVPIAALAKVQLDRYLDKKERHLKEALMAEPDEGE